MFSEYMIIAVFYILGIIISKIYDISFSLFFSLFMASVGIMRMLKNKRQALGILILSAVFLIGGARYFGESQNRLYHEFGEKYVTVSGVVYSLPSTSGDTYRYVVKTDSVSYLDATAHTKSKILIHTKETLPFGTKFTASGFLTEIDGIDNEYETDYSLYYRGKGVYTRLSAMDITTNGSAFSLSPAFLFEKARYHAFCIIENHFDGHESAFLKAILLGDRSGFSKEYTDTLIQVGTFRVLYSGFIHISLIFFIVGFLPLSRKNRESVALILVCIYGIINSAYPGIMKTALIIVLMAYSKRISGYSDKPDLLSQIVLIMTFLNPYLCFNAGFIMSVSATLILYFTYKPLYIKFLHVFRFLSVGIRKFLSRILTLWVAFLLGTLPVCAFLFNGASVYSVLITLLLTPLIFLILILSPLMLMSFASLGASPVLAPVICIAIKFVERVSLSINRLPAHYIPLKTPTILEIFMFYLVLWAFLQKLSKKTTQTTVIIVTVIGLSLSALPVYIENSMSIDFVNVGQGDGAVLHTSKGETILIDGGGAPVNETDYNVGKEVFVPYLVSHGFHNIDVAILTHYHKDHAEGILAAAESLSVNTIVMPPVGQDDFYHKALLSVAEEKGIKIEYLTAGDEINFKSGLNIRFISPSHDMIARSDENDVSLVAHVTYGSFSALFTGDATMGNSHNYPEDIDLLKVAHHGSESQTSDEFLNVTRPKYAVISVGADNSYGLPNYSTLLRLENLGAKILRTDRHGNIKITVNKNGKFTYKTLRGE